MSWSDDIRCLYCDGKLALYRKLTNGQFCSAAHRKAYWQEQEKLALERLHQTRDTLLTQKKPETSNAKLSLPVSSPFFVESQFPTPAEQATRLDPEHEAIARSASNTDRVGASGFLIDSALGPVDWIAILSIQDPEPLAWAQLPPTIPHQLSDRLVRDFSMADAVEMPLNLRSVGLPLPSPNSLELALPTALLPSTASAGLFTGNLPRGSAVRIAHLITGSVRSLSSVMDGAVAPLLSTPPVVLKNVQSGIALETPELKLTAEALPNKAASDVVIVEDIFNATQLRTEISVEPNEPVPAGIIVAQQPVAEVPETPVAQVEVAEPVAVVEEPSRAMAAAVPMPPIDGHARAFQAVSSVEEISIAASTPVLCGSSLLNTEASLTAASAVEFPKQSAIRGTDAALKSIKPADPATHRQDVAMGAFGIPASLSPSAQLAPKFAPGARYLIEFANKFVHAEAEPKPLLQNLTPVMNRLPESIRVIVEPGNGGVVALPFRPTAAIPAQFKVVAPQLALIDPKVGQPMLTRAKLQPVDGEVAPMPKRKLLGMEIWTPVASGDAKHVWGHAADFWQNAPRDLKLLVIAIPVLLGLALHPSLPKVRVTAPKTSARNIDRNIEEIKGGFGSGLSRQFQLVRRTVSERAAVALNEDFRSGLDDWQARGDLSSGWSFDRNGFVKPINLALYRPSMNLTDYDTEFLGLIDQKALSFVARAKDFDNYYVIKITIVKPGPIPTIGVTRYAVIDGKPQDRKDTIAPITARPDMLYRVGLSVQGDTFLLTLQGQVTDSWTETRLDRGGIGFFAARGEESRLRWVQVTHQYDMLGRLCAFLAPQNIPNTNGSW